MRVTSRRILFWGIELLLLVTFLPITQCLPSVIRWALQIGSISFFIIGLSLEKNKRYVLGYFACVLFGVIYVYNVWHFNQSITTCVFNVMACFAFAYYGIVSATLDNQDGDYQRKVSITTILIITVTALTTIVGLYKYPLAVRELGRVGSGYDTSGQAFLDLKNSYRLMNIASWSIVYGIVFTVPWFINRFKDTKKYRYLIGVVIVLFCLLKAQLTIGIILAALLLFFSLFKPSKKPFDVVVTMIILTIGIVLLLFCNEILLFVIDFSNNHNLGMISNKLQDLVYFLQGNQTGDILARFERYTSSIDVFFEHPLTGISIYGVPYYGLFGNHSDFFDMLGYYGLFGVSVIVAIIIRYFRIIRTSRYINEKWRLIVPLFAFLAFFVLNPVWYSPQVFATAIMLPCCAFANYRSHCNEAIGDKYE